ncbi:DUF456 domain-containing protein [Gramella sp. AN32]|uniref:DUF456 domain-containing protein n=1 Tax=Christiangramia antarctica TaxID=2058158 RepID=A0ABW5X7R1_9FLAO|nr:DUF456 domain-containing protein [Gramella sp. AN32]MCM4155436.1 DUF456 domain-containing protein [Gramella sp. AN32]
MLTLSLIIISLLLMILGLLGSFLPVLPGVPLSWLGLLLFFFIPLVPFNYWLLGITLLVAILIFILDWIIPAMGTKKFGGSKKGMIGATLGLIAGIFTPIPFAVLIGPFIGAFIGELINRSGSKTAGKAALGSFLGIMASSFMEFVVAFSFFVLYLYQFWSYRGIIF